MEGFPGGIAENSHFMPGTLLYRFSGWDIISRDEKGNERVSPWWSESSGLLDTLLSAKMSGETLWDYVRQKSAVLRGWNSLGYLVMIRLNKPKEGFRGLIAPQNEANPFMNNGSKQYKGKYTKPVGFSGGGRQVFVPDLSRADFEIAIPLGSVFIYDNIDEIIDFLNSYKLI